MLLCRSDGTCNLLGWSTFNKETMLFAGLRVRVEQHALLTHVFVSVTLLIFLYLLKETSFLLTEKILSKLAFLFLLIFFSLLLSKESIFATLAYGEVYSIQAAQIILKFNIYAVWKPRIYSIS
jgi:hypothetical protein